MAQFRGVLRGQRGEASRLGTKSSGLTAHINGWNCGVDVELEHLNDQDQVIVYLTGGSNGRSRKVLFRGSVDQVQEFINNNHK